jgi:hypothetical protein
MFVGTVAQYTEVSMANSHDRALNLDDEVDQIGPDKGAGRERLLSAPPGRDVVTHQNRTGPIVLAT